MTDISTIDARKAIAGKYAAKYSLDAALVCALVEHESSWNPWANKHEPMFYDRYIQPLVNKGTIRNITEAKDRSTSFGLMQVMGEVAREYGFAGRFLTELCDPDVGLDYGCKKLRRCFDTHGADQIAALLQYNGAGDVSYPRMVLDLVGKYQ